MGLMDILGVDNPVTRVIEAVVNRIPDPHAREMAEIAAAQAAQAGELQLAQGQIEVNKVEAASSSFWVAGWRPCIGWICAAGLAYQFVAYPFMVWGTKLAGYLSAWPPELDAAQLMTLVTGMLGLGAFRTFEKTKGVAQAQSSVSRRAALAPPAKR